MVVKLNNFLKAGQKFQMLTQHSMSLTEVILEGRSFFFMGKSYNRFSYSCDV